MAVIDGDDSGIVYPIVQAAIVAMAESNKTSIKLTDAVTSTNKDTYLKNLNPPAKEITFTIDPDESKLELKAEDVSFNPVLPEEDDKIYTAAVSRETGILTITVSEDEPKTCEITLAGKNITWTGEGVSENKVSIAQGAHLDIKVTPVSSSYELATRTVGVSITKPTEGGKGVKAQVSNASAKEATVTITVDIDATATEATVTFADASEASGDNNGKTPGDDIESGDGQETGKDTNSSDSGGSSGSVSSKGGKSGSGSAMSKGAAKVAGLVPESSTVVTPPSANTTRQALWMVLARMSGTYPSNMAEARAWSINAGISDGTNGEGSMSRQQFITMLYRFAQQQGTVCSLSADRSGFSDSGVVASYAQEALAWDVANGIITGTSDGRLNPEGTATRAHFAAFVYRFANMG